MFSVLTTTYNSGHLIHRVYDSLLNQTFKEFEWIIVDDGSTDKTEEVVLAWQKTSNFPIKYHKMPENQGKAYGINTGIEICNRPFTINADADDTFSPQTLQDLKIIWETIDKTQESDKIGAVWTLVQDEQGNLIGEPWPKNFWQVSFEERVLNRKRDVIGEKWHSWRTNVLRKHKKFVNPNSRINPSVSWNRINKHHDFLCVNVIHRTYFKNPEGYTLQNKSTLKIMKRLYYSGYYELASAKLFDIIRVPYYRNYAFEYIKARFYYNDSETRLTGLRFILVLLIFVVSLPQRLFQKILTNS